MVICILCAKKDSSVSYHGFPKNEEIRKKWTEFCGITEEILVPYSTLCSNHFEKCDLIRRLNRMEVRRGAIPKIYSKKRKYRSPCKTVVEVRHEVKEPFEQILVKEEPLEQILVKEEPLQQILVKEEPLEQILVKEEIKAEVKNGEMYY